MVLRLRQAFAGSSFWKMEKDEKNVLKTGFAGGP
jgi:hypothetical protein